MLEGLTIAGITLTPEACSDILETAVEAGHTYGFGYWAELVDRQVEGDSASFYLWIKLREHEHCTNPDLPGRKFTVGHADIQLAVLRMLQDPKACACRGLIPQLAQDNSLDGPLAEAIIQVACFGEVIYG